MTSIEHNIVPTHIVCKEEEIKKILSKFNIKKQQLPKIDAKDKAIAQLKLEEGTVIKIERKSETEPNSTFYRVVVE